MAKYRGRKAPGSALVEDLVLSCTGEGVSPEDAQIAARAMCRYYGGMMIYVPAKKEAGASAENLRRVIADAAGDRVAGAVVSRMMKIYGGLQIYIPLERCAFKKIIALEIYTRREKGGISMKDLAREYNITVNTVYILWKRGRHEKLKPSMPYLPFLELAEHTNRD
jgi:Mor family transcriptional regulator